MGAGCLRGELAPVLSPSGISSSSSDPSWNADTLGVFLVAACCWQVPVLSRGAGSASGSLVCVPVTHLASSSSLSPCPLWALFSSLRRKCRAAIWLRLCILDPCRENRETPSPGVRRGMMGTGVERPVLRDWACQQGGQTGVRGLLVVPGHGWVADSPAWPQPEGIGCTLSGVQGKGGLGQGVRIGQGHTTGQ